MKKLSQKKNNCQIGDDRLVLQIYSVCVCNLIFRLLAFDYFVLGPNLHNIIVDKNQFLTIEGSRE